ncbi:hypothetical protein FC70_GL000515 [Paucilactobacillus oligofermentans DSM 15707 = LMG 22743]|uniref:DUF3042 domain-containing protein n=1 Tax=Paucilactobacillus oligofermentans DSM 15707 = LMG 22743 TaxID=1423778 RepID=A0A0R1RN51_9LACO|nr:DUF3042 family protein [Paucilactobacillus oligofermentans]KRL55930.1 hypothetical protein FC70_GL000515 [Paucilactobacillus oligofermentans DSM 15707 = LMG 22743]CUS26089.1 Uncharacterized protein LACOL_0781 [Paucilactobacillus oligofermentans DSM 15707 = LMG 22743]
MKSFTKGVVIGTAATIGAVVGGLFSYHRKVVKPIEDQEIKFDENRRTANRKNRSAHNL